ncbi:ADP-ribosylglycohydrolase family protein [Verrucomicrobiota bacterium sgz303538]
MNIDCQLDYTTILQGRSETVHLALVFRAAVQASERSAPFAFGLVLDNSGSMAGTPIEHAKAAAKMVITHLRPEDQVGVVTFADSARTVVPLQPARNKAQLQSLVSAISAEGSTNLTGGWMLGRDELTKAPAEMPRKLLLLTDGQLNVGIVEPEQVRQIVGNGLEKEQVRTSCLGFGDNYNEDLLNVLSRSAGGALHDADSPEKLPGIFRQELESLLKLSAQNLRIRVKKLHYCSGFGLLSDYPTVALPEGGVEIAMGDMVSEEERVVVLALEVLPLPGVSSGPVPVSLEGEALLEIECLYDELVPEGVVSKKEQRTIRVLPVQSEKDVKVNESAIEWVAEQVSGRAIAEAIKERDSGDTTAVQARISSAKERLSQYNRPDKTRAATNTLDRFHEASHCWDSRSRKVSRMISTGSLRTSSYYKFQSAQHFQLRSLYDELSKKGSLAVEYAKVGSLWQLPRLGLYGAALEARALGCLLGGAVGDALGRAREGRQPGGEWITEYQPWHGWTSGPKGTITDDTQFTMWLAASLVKRGNVDPVDLLNRFTSETIRGIGQATLAFVTNVKVAQKQWFESGVPAAGNGVAMRSSPIGLFFGNEAEVFKLGSILQAVVTHNDPMAIASGIITAQAVAALLRVDAQKLEPLEKRKEFCVKLADLIAGMEASGNYRTRNTKEPATLEQRFREDLPRWLEENLEPLEVNERYWSGAYVLESLPHAFYCFLRTPGDFRETLLQAVNTSHDSDTVAAIACNLSGALNGISGIPQMYLDELEFRKELESLARLLCS